MKYYFCLVPDSDNTGVNIGKTYAYAHRSTWKECTDICTYLTTGYVKGVDHCVYDGKAYTLMKTYLDLTEKFAVIIAVESVSGCDI